MLTRLFPAPSFIALPSVGVDFSDATMRFVRLAESGHGFLPTHYGEVTIPEGCIKGGRIVDEAKFTAFLAEARKAHQLSYVRVAIPESQTYSFTVTLDALAGQDIRGAIELILEDNIPLRAIETVFDYHIMKETEKSLLVQVVASADVSVQSYCSCLVSAGLIPISFELDGQAVARAVLKPEDDGSYMVVDFGAHRTSITIVSHGTAVFTSTLEFGGKVLREMLEKQLGVSTEEAQRLKRDVGLSSNSEHKEIFDLLVGGISTLKDEINRRYIYWHEKKGQLGDFATIDTVYLCGGHSNLKGLADYLSVGLKLSVKQVNPWTNCVSFDDAIPAMLSEESMSYVTTIGLALADYLND